MDKITHISSDRVMEMRTICEVHREIYDILEVHFKDSKHYNDVICKLEEAYIMAKKMNKKLRQYKFDYDNDWWEETTVEIQQEKLQHRTKRKK